MWGGLYFVVKYSCWIGLIEELGPCGFCWSFYYQKSRGPNGSPMVPWRNHHWFLEDMLFWWRSGYFQRNILLMSGCWNVYRNCFWFLGRDEKYAVEHGGKTRIQTSLYRIDGLNPISRVELDRGKKTGLLGHTNGSLGMRVDPLDDAGFQLLVANSKVFWFGIPY